MSIVRIGAAALGALIFCSAVSATNTVRLRRFEMIDPYKNVNIPWGERQYRYMDVADTTLDSRHPDDNFGAAHTLALKPRQTNRILLQFDQLNRAIARGSRITDVKLVLRPVPGRFTPNTVVQLHRMTTEWRDGGANGEPMYWTATYNAAFSSPRDNAIKWASAGAAGSADARSQPSVVQNTSANYNPVTNTWTLSGPGLLEDVRYWFGRQHKNFGWVIRMQDPKNAIGPVEFWSSDVMDKDLRPELVVTFEPLLTEGEQKGIDLNVTFISRTPRYFRYNDNGRTTYERKRFRDDNPGIMKFPDNADTKKWPDKGEVMTYTATIKNSGFEAYRGQLDYVWTYNGKVIKRGTKQVNLGPEQTTTEAIQMPWSGDLRDIRDEKLWFEIDPADKVKEITENNNAQSKYLKARTWKYWVEQKPYNFQKDYLTAYGSYSYEDYLKWHEQIWNETFLNRSRFDGTAPDGSTQRITLDDFEIVADGRLGGGIHRLDDKPDFNFDGEWGTEWVKGEAAKDPAQIANIQNFMRGQRVFLEGSLLHEASHQVLGAFDVYWSNMEPSDPINPNGKVKVKDGGEHYITRGYMYAYAGLMGGDDTRPNALYTEGTGLFALHDIMGFTLNTPYRNGFYGEWQYDMPKNNFIRLTAADGSPIPNAKVTIWQSSANQMVDKNQVAANLTADNNGVLRLPDQDSGEPADYTTITGHTLRKKNPFGRIDVVGVNTVFLIKVEGHGQRDYRFLRLLDLNRAYWAGNKENYTHDLRTQITPGTLDLTKNLARGKGVQTVLNPAEAGRLTDGNREESWNGGVAPTGSFIQIDLGDTDPIGAVRIIQNGGHGEFFQRFKIEASDDPSFRTGVTELNRQFPYSFGLAMTNDRDIDPQNLSIRWVHYGAHPTKAGFLRITNLGEQWGARLAEIEVFAAERPADAR